MRLFVFFLATVTSVFAAPQGVTSEIKPPGPAPSGSVPSYNGIHGNRQFGFNVVQIPTTPSSRRSTAAERTCDLPDALRLQLRDGVLMSPLEGRTGYIADNYQLQFDGPPQAGAIYTAGFSIMPNNTLALGSSSIWWACNSGKFANLYDRYWAAQCYPVGLEIHDLKDC